MLSFYHGRPHLWDMRRMKHASTPLLALFLACLMASPALGAVVTKATPVDGAGEYASADEAAPVHVYPIDGFAHNPQHPDWGATNTLLGRLGPATHEDGTGLGLAHLPNPREISNIVCKQPEVIDDERGLSDFNWLWGQFITHEIDFTLTQNGRVDVNTAAERADIMISENDSTMGAPGGARMMFFRSLYESYEDDDGNTFREHPNSISAWLDGGVVYGNDMERATWLREFEGGRLKVSDYAHGDLLPIGDDESPGMSFGGFSADVRFIAGDARANEHIALMAIHVLFVREHNRLADIIQERNPDWSDEMVYQRARKINNAIMQAITYEEFLPSLGVELPAYPGHDPNVDPTVTNAFATVAFRMGHSQIGDHFFRLDEERQMVPDGHMTLFDGFWTTTPVTQQGGLAPILRGLAFNTQPANDVYFGDDLRDRLFGVPRQGGMDLCAIDIQRGRDHGVLDYNSYRELLGVGRATNWSDVTTNAEVASRLASAYANVDEVDPLIGMLAEDHLEDSALGPTMDALIEEQFVRLQVGDPLWYENDAELADIVDEIRGTTLTDVILRNTEIEQLQCDVFFAERDLSEMDCAHANAEEWPRPVEEAGTLTSNVPVQMGIIGVLLLALAALAVAPSAVASTDEEE